MTQNDCELMRRFKRKVIFVPKTAQSNEWKMFIISRGKPCLLAERADLVGALDFMKAVDGFTSKLQE